MLFQTAVQENKTVPISKFRSFVHDDKAQEGQWESNQYEEVFFNFGFKVSGLCPN